MRSVRLLAVMLSASVAAASRSGAQLAQQRIQSEVRVDGLFASSGAVHSGYGVSIPAGIYVRSGFVGAIGGGTHGFEGRADLFARFNLDPFRQSRWAPYGGAGISGRFRPRSAGGPHAYLLTYVGLEGPLEAGSRAGWVPALELGLGGGARLGIILRRGVPARR